MTKKRKPGKGEAEGKGAADRVWHGSPELEPLLVPICDLSEDPKNARVHGAKNTRTIHASYCRHGQRKTVVADSAGRVIAGNGQLHVARDLGWTHLAVSRYDGDEETLAAFAVEDNRTGDLAAWDPNRLDEILSGLPTITLEEIGFDLADLEILLGGLPAPKTLAPMEILGSDGAGIALIGDIEMRVPQEVITGFGEIVAAERAEGEALRAAASRVLTRMVREECGDAPCAD